MRTVCFHGTQLSAGQRRQIDFQNLARKAFLSNVLTESVELTLNTLESRKQQGLKPERIWSLDREESGTPCFADWMGF